jgi:hypothetical protein
MPRCLVGFAQGSGRSLMCTLSRDWWARSLTPAVVRTATVEDRESDGERAVKVEGGGRGVAGQSEPRAWLEEAASLVVVIGALESSRTGSCCGIEVVASCRGAEVFAASREGDRMGLWRVGGSGSHRWCRK